ncbi:MAG TPA: GatB/YqeY domain-containing protein [Xanthobacteraceae bacterium]|nr:GatB/YqeY domain-containing protein [Xanthobacteraceae bacterium]
MLRDEINAALKDAMKARDQRRVSTLRLINSAIQSADIEAGGLGKPALADDALLAILQKMIKQRHESADIYEKGGRAELAKQEREEIEIITAYLPKQMSDVEAGAAISSIVQEINAQGMKDMGRVMAALKERFTGKLDFAKASAKVKEMLKG